MAPTDQLSTQLDRLSAIEAGPFPFVSLYLNTQPDQHGRDNFEPFLRKELQERVRTYPAEGPERESLEQDAAKIRDYVATLPASANGVAIFACSAAGVFETVELAAPIEQHALFLSTQPHLYPLARLLDQFPRYAVVVADTNLARIFVVAGHAVEATHQIANTKTRRHKMGGWAQARYQRHIENYHQQHAKEVAEALARIVRDEGVTSIVIAGDEVIVPMLKEQMPKDVAERVVDVVKLDVHSPERDILDTTLETMREKDAETDRARVDALLGAYRAGGLAVVGVEPTMKAFELGQVDELVLTARPDTIDAPDRAADELVIKARQTAAKIRFIEDAALLAAVGGVGAFLRFKL
jgi:peptide subunit release factor 1 (eRF1)